MIRLNKFLAERLGVSRRQADDLISAGKIKIEFAKNNDFGTDKEAQTGVKTATLGDRIDKNDRVWYNGSIIPFDVGYFYIAMNKPVGYVCSKKRQGQAPTIYELLPKEYQNLKTVGRLDKDSSGLIILTNDGDFAFSMTHPKFIKEKIYEVELDRDLKPLHRQMIADYGIELADGKSKLGLTRMIDDRKDPLYDRCFRVTMSEGRNRQIRRTFAALGYEVVKLHRTNFGKYALDGLKSGEIAKITK